jgi:hypothetical protein
MQQQMFVLVHDVCNLSGCYDNSDCICDSHYGALGYCFHVDAVYDTPMINAGYIGDLYCDELRYEEPIRLSLRSGHRCVLC